MLFLARWHTVQYTIIAEIASGKETFRSCTRIARPERFGPSGERNGPCAILPSLILSFPCCTVRIASLESCETHAGCLLPAVSPVQVATPAWLLEWLTAALFNDRRRFLSFLWFPFPVDRLPTRRQ